MSRDSKGELIARILVAMRAADSNMDRIEDAAANRLRIHRTDFRCLDILSRGSSMTAGQLARAAGLSTGAVTALLDRLERSGYIRRTADPEDRRKVVIEPTRLAGERVWPVFKEFVEHSTALLQRFGKNELETIAHFAEQHDALIARQAERVSRGENSA